MSCLQLTPAARTHERDTEGNMVCHFLLLIKYRHAIGRVNYLFTSGVEMKSWVILAHFNLSLFSLGLLCVYHRNVLFHHYYFKDETSSKCGKEGRGMPCRKCVVSHQSKWGLSCSRGVCHSHSATGPLQALFLITVLFI